MTRSLPLAGEPRVPQRTARLALAAKGFRPFFLLAGLFALLTVPTWLLMFFGMLSTDNYLDASSWHAHEMIFGFATAVIAGFLLTAVGNWTQRETLTGAPLLALATLWIAGRVCMLYVADLPFAVPMLVDLSFLPLLIAALTKTLLAAKNVRNYPLVVVLSVLCVCNGFVHAQALGILALGTARQACILAVDVVLLVVMIVIGRVLPMFTRNATRAADVRSVKALDYACLAAMALLGVSDIVTPHGPPATALAALTAVLAVARAWHWGVQHTLRHPLLWVLHCGYAWMVVGLGMRALAGLHLIPASLATHALTVGVIGTLTLGMMARVALGHTGRALTASRSITCAFLAINFAAAARAVLPWLMPGWHLQSLWIAGGLWTVAFLLFVVSYAPVLGAPRVDGKPG